MSRSATPRAVFVLPDLSLETGGGLTKAWLRRIRLFAGAGWEVHVALITPDLQLGRTLRVCATTDGCPGRSSSTGTGATRRAR